MTDPSRLRFFNPKWLRTDERFPVDTMNHGANIAADVFHGRHVDRIAELDDFSF
jgi:hypothetical protein